MNYDLSIRPNRSGIKPANRGSVEYAFARFVELRKERPGLFLYGEASRRSLVRIQVDDTDPVERIRVSIPSGFLRSDGASVLRLCFKIADELGWGILDEQLGAYIERDAIPDVVNRYENLDESMTEFLDRKPTDKPRFADVYRFNLLNQSRAGLLACAVVAAFLTSLLIVVLDVPALSFLWMSVIVFLAVVSTKTLAQSIRRIRRSRDSIRDNPV